MKTELLTRTFEASKHTKGSEERNRLNSEIVTSEYMTSMRYLTVIHHPETVVNTAYKSQKTHKTKTEAIEYLIQKKDAYAKDQRRN